MCDKESYKRNFQALLLYDAREYAPKMGAKTLIVIGKEDPIINLQLGIAMHQKITDSKLEIFEQVGHVVFAEEPEKFNTIVRNFLQESQ